MISEDCRIEAFFDAIEGKTVTEAITLANSEATAAERLMLQSKHRLETACPDNAEYVDRLKEFILFARCAVMKNRISQDRYHKLFNSYLQSV